MNMTLPTDSDERKEYPLYRGLWRYFPAALAGVAQHSKHGNDKHNPGQPMHHARDKSSDHADCILRHLMDIADLEWREPTPYNVARLIDEADALVWRALALSQIIHEQRDGAPLAPGAKSSHIEVDKFGYHIRREGYPHPRCPLCCNEPCTCPNRIAQ